jgi:hypothetical protein
MHWGKISNFQNTFDTACDEIRMEIQTENVFRSLISRPPGAFRWIFWHGRIVSDQVQVRFHFLLNPLSKESTCKVRNEIETKRNEAKRNSYIWKPLGADRGVDGHIHIKPNEGYHIIPRHLVWRGILNHRLNYK